MFTKTTELAFRALVVIGLHEDDRPLRPQEIADRLGASPSYLRKTLGLLSKAGVIQAVRGAQGGVLLERRPEQVSLLEVVEACEGVIVGAFCHPAGTDPQGSDVCGYHRAMRDVYDSTVAALSRWSLADLLSPPQARGKLPKGVRCTMRQVESTVTPKRKGRA